MEQMKSSLEGRQVDKQVDKQLAEITAKLAANRPKPIGRYRRYSVLIPLIPTDIGLQVLFQVRADGLRHQPGEIGFPGGKMEQGETAKQCAIRETCEEMGVTAADISLLGETNYLITYSNFTMYAFAGAIGEAALAAATPNRAEVKTCFLAPLSFFLENEPAVYQNEIRPVVAADFPYEKIQFKQGYSWRTGSSTVPVYSYHEAETGEERVIWGLTALLIRDFARLLRGER